MLQVCLGRPLDFDPMVAIIYYPIRGKTSITTEHHIGSATISVGLGVTAIVDVSVLALKLPHVNQN